MSHLRQSRKCDRASHVVSCSLVLSLVRLSAEIGLAMICGPDRKSSIIC